MGKIAIVFSGQGAQYPGMGKSFYENCESAKKLYDFADSYRPGTSAQSFSGTAEELKLTKNTQPCLYLVDICAALALKEKGISADGVAGFSLGEIAALAYAGSYTPEQGFEIVCERAKFMQEAAEKNDTAMAAVLKFDNSEIENLCRKISADCENVYPVNYNSPVQTVIAGTKKAIASFKENASGARIIDLAVGAAFHSPFMDGAAKCFSDYLSEKNLAAPSSPVYSNYNALPYGEDVYATLKMQINNPVRWCDTINNMIADGYTDFIEAGAGKTLCGLIKKTSSEVRTYSAGNFEEVEATVKAVRENA